MANSPTHRFGQIIGEVLEAAIEQPLTKVAGRHGLYLDRKRPRAARGGKSKVRWMDHKGNRHDLDYVLEAGGTEANVGRPKAFIEIAYRRYTKHSRNKAQEIQGAIAPLFETYSHDHPFIGVVLAGLFTEGSLAQLRSHGFGVLYMPFESLVRAFRSVGIDANFDEGSSDAAVQHKLATWDALPTGAAATVGAAIRKIESRAVRTFFAELEKALVRAIKRVFVVALYGHSRELASVDAAVRFIEQLDEGKPSGRFARYEVHVHFTNDDEIRGAFESKAEAIRFLRVVA